MNEERFEKLTAEEQEWIDALLDGSIEPAAFAALQDRMLERRQLRAVMRRSLALHNALHERAAEQDTAADSWLDRPAADDKFVPLSAPRTGLTGLTGWGGWPLALAAGMAFLLGLASMHYFRTPQLPEEARVLPPKPGTRPPEVSANGFAVVGNLFDARWADGADHRSGDSLGAETLRLESGVAEVQFFSGATMVIRGPAEIVLTSAWEADCRAGVVRMRVPPAARGFRLQAPATKIVDLGTEFGLEVRDGRAHVEVLDGEISFRHRNEGERIVEKGGAWGLPTNAEAAETEAGRVNFPSLDGSGPAARALVREDYLRWQEHRRAFARDPRVLAYYTFDRPAGTSVVASLKEPRNPEFDGAVVLAETAAGRWPGFKDALEFRRPGSRVRVHVPGEFKALTFAVWVRIDSLDRRYNALFMGDGYENGEPHWQIRDDGRLMLSVMVDDRKLQPQDPTKGRYHRVYFSPPIWDLSKSGRWLHIASVYDRAGREVSHYVNGRRISREAVPPDLHIDTLRIGNAEIGNWGEPFRTTPWFAIRNLNGRIDELAILNAALGPDEIRKLHGQSRSALR